MGSKESEENTFNEQQLRESQEEVERRQTDSEERNIKVYCVSQRRQTGLRKSKSFKKEKGQKGAKFITFNC